MGEPDLQVARVFGTEESRGAADEAFPDRAWERGNKEKSFTPCDRHAISPH